jgi:penicillin-binding protein 2
MQHGLARILVLLRISAGGRIQQVGGQETVESMHNLYKQLRALALVVSLASPAILLAAHVDTRQATRPRTKITEPAKARRRISKLHQSRRHTASRGKKGRTHTASRRRHHYHERFFTSSYATDTLNGDITEGEDATVRAAAIDALGNMNGTVTAIDPNSGRILAMVNQKLALSAGAQPCSTIKVPVALAALSEGIVTKDTEIPLGRYSQMNMTTALARSNNAYFEALGRKLGFARVHRYAQRFGLGELAGYDIPGEHRGVYPTTEISEKLGGVGKMCSFGEGISMTPLQLGALVSAIANGGTLYYLQHPESPEEVKDFEPRLKRMLNISDAIPEMADGLSGATHYGTARHLRLSFSEEEVLGKTGTCSHAGTRFGWFASYVNTDAGDIVIVVFLRGGRPTYGPKAAEIAGKMYRGLYDHSFFAAKVVAPKIPEAAQTIEAKDPQ